MSWIRALTVALLVLLASSSVAVDRPRIAIIIDDLGYRLDAGRRLVQLLVVEKRHDESRSLGSSAVVG